MMNSKNNIVLSVIVVALFAGGVFYFASKAKPTTNPDGVVCTMEAKLCPDGSYVGRGGPKCEFSACPGAKPTGVDMSDWKTTKDSDSKVSFQYPQILGTKYIDATDWPPKVQVIEGKFSCTDAGEPNARAGQTITRTINGHSYCVTTVSEGAAGSTYIQYAYETSLKSTNVYYTFTLRFPQCANYDDPQKTACQKERTTFDLDTLMDQIIQSSIF